MRLHIVTYGDPILRKKGELITDFDDELKTLLDNMLDTCKATGALGLAAQQVGLAKRCFVLNCGVDDARTTNKDCILDGKHIPSFDMVMPLYIVNPKIVELGSEMASYQDGCMSFPGGVHAVVTRPNRMKMEFQDALGMTHTLEAEGLVSWCCQHEIDHLDGKLITDHFDQRSLKRLESKLKMLRRYTRDFIKQHKSCTYPIPYENAGTGA